MSKLLILILFLSPIALQAQTAAEIIESAEDQVKGKTSKGTFIMRVVTPEFTRELTMNAWWKGNEKALIEITAPPKEKGNKTLKIGNEMWNYLKNTDRVIKIPPSMMLQSWMGSDLTNDDIVRESKLTDDYSTRIMFEEKIAGDSCWKIELTPKPDVPVVWGKIYYWVRKQDTLPALVQYYDESGDKHRTMKFYDYQMMSGRKIPKKWKIIDNKKEGHYTLFIYEDVEFNIRIPDRIFTRRQLER